MLLQPKQQLGDDDVHVWHALIGEVPALHELDALLLPEELARMRCLHHAKDRDLFLLSRAVMRSVLASYLDCDGCDICLVGDNHGKPMLRPDRHPAELHFNLTHSRGAVALAVSRREVGVDVEDRRRRVEYLALAERFFSPPESEHLRRLPERELPEAFFAIWTLKEAFVKGLGRGIAFPLEAFAFDLDVDRLIAFRPLADFVSRDWHFQQFTLGERHRGAVAVARAAGERVRIELRDWVSAFVPSSHAGGSA